MIDITARGLASKNASSLADIAYDVKKYGAVGDGVTDDYTSIQNAISAAANSTNGGIVYLPPGQYRINSGLYLASNVTLTGAGMKLTTILPYSTSGLTAINGGGTPSAPFVNVEISHLKIDGTNASQPSYTPGTKGIFMSYLKNFRCLYVHVYNTYASGIGTDFLIQSVIHGCVVENCGRAAVGQTVVGSNGIGIGTGWATETESVVISDCFAINCGNSGVMFENQEGSASKWDGYYQVLNCISMGNRWGFRDSGNMRMKFVGNTAKNNLNDGFMLSGGVNSGAQGYLAKETMINDNVITNNGQQGIHIYNAHTDGGFMIMNNRIAENGSHGIYTEVPIYKSKIKGNHIYKNGITGVELWNTVYNSDVSENMIYENQNNGIRLANGGNRVDIRSNKIFNNGKINDGSSDRDGIRLLANTANLSEIIVKHNKVFDDAATKTQRRGITLGTVGTGTLDNLTIENNDVQGNATSPNLSVTGTNARIRNNVGYNPIGISLLTVGASPWTYTAGSSPEIIYIDGGTVSLIQKNGSQVFTTTNKTVSLEPNETLTITYSSAPTVKTDIH